MRAIREFLKHRVEKHDGLWNFSTSLLDYYYLIRVKNWITSLAGPMYSRSRDIIEIDITYACNLMCYGCNRSCGLAPTTDRIHLDQIRRFLRETEDKGITWRKIALLGGEPTLHPQFLEILEELCAFKKRLRLGTTIALVTNGYNGNFRSLPPHLAAEVVVHNGRKTSRVQYFKPFNLAPRDFPRYRRFSFSRGCKTLACGMGLSPYGYYHCPVAASIDRIMGFDIGRKSLPDPADAMRDQMETLCGYCGHFTTFKWMALDQDVMSETWRRAYQQYNLAPPHMSFY